MENADIRAGRASADPKAVRAAMLASEMPAAAINGTLTSSGANAPPSAGRETIANTRYEQNDEARRRSEQDETRACPDMAGDQQPFVAHFVRGHTEHWADRNWHSEKLASSIPIIAGEAPKSCA
jgi:hypothetical protein